MGIASLNVKGLKETAKREQIMQHMKNTIYRYSVFKTPASHTPVWKISKATLSCSLPVPPPVMNIMELDSAIRDPLKHIETTINNSIVT
eukprot:16361201-Heterocapsa_arctica.AAC.1